MPNWCYNSVEFSGSKEDIRRMKSIVEKVEQGLEQGAFEKLIGRDESITDEQFKDGGWYDHNIDRYGTKWDVGKDGFDFYDESGTWSADTAWSPPINFWKICSEMYNLDVEMYWEEAGNAVTPANASVMVSDRHARLIPAGKPITLSLPSRTFSGKYSKPPS